MECGDHPASGSFHAGLSSKCLCRASFGQKIRAESSSNGSSTPDPHNSSTLSSHQISRLSKHEELRNILGFLGRLLPLPRRLAGAWCVIPLYLDEWVHYFSYSWGMASGGFQRAANFVFVLTSDFYLGFWLSRCGLSGIE